MLRLFAIKNTAFNDDVLFEKYLAVADGERRKRIAALVPREKKNESLAAGVILPLALKKCGVSGDVKVERDRFGKPRLITPQGVFFNLSHSGEWTVIALSDSEVGVDIQQEKSACTRRAARLFGEGEREYIAGAGDGADLLFFRLWTVKEAYLKAIGTGLNRPLDSFSVRFTESGTTVEDGETADGWFVWESGFFKGYRMACVAKQGAPDCPPEILKTE